MRAHARARISWGWWAAGLLTAAVLAFSVVSLQDAVRQAQRRLLLERTVYEQTSALTRQIEQLQPGANGVVQPPASPSERVRAWAEAQGVSDRLTLRPIAQDSRRVEGVIAGITWQALVGMLAGLDKPGVALQLEQLQVQALAAGSLEAAVRLGGTGLR